MSKALKIGLIGASRIAASAIIAPAKAMPFIEVVAIAARDRARGAAFASQFDIATLHDSYEALINDPNVELVYIATPPSLHTSLALRAIDAGKAVLVEKPMTTSVVEAEQILAQAQRKGVQVFEAMHALHHPVFAHVRTVLSSAPLGRIERMTAIFTAPIVDDGQDFRWSRTLGGGALADLGIYPLAWCRYVAGEAFRVEDGVASYRHGVDATVSATLVYEQGIRASIRTSMLDGPHEALLRIEGSAGWLEIDNPLVPHLGHRFTVGNQHGAHTSEVAGLSTYEAQLEAVRATLMDGAAFPLPANDFVHSARAIEKVYAAIGRGAAASERPFR